MLFDTKPSLADKLSDRDLTDKEFTQLTKDATNEELESAMTEITRRLELVEQCCVEAPTGVMRSSLIKLGSILAQRPVLETARLK